MADLRPPRSENGATRASLRVAVVIPTRNRRDLLMATLDGLEAQTRPPDEIVVVVDGATDGTTAALAARNVRTVQTEGIGAAGARNAGWAATTADVVAFTDDDCRSDPDWLERLVAPLAAAADVGIAQGRTIPAGEVRLLDRSIQVERETGLYETCNIAYRRAALEAVGGFDARFGASRWSGRGGRVARPFGEDTDLAWRVRRAGWETVFVDDAVVRHHVFPGTYGDRVREAWRQGNFAPLVRHIPELRERLPGGPWFLYRHDPLVQLALVGVALGIRRPRALALTAPYAAWLLRRHRAPGPLMEQAGRDAVRSVALATASVRARSLLL